MVFGLVLPIGDQELLKDFVLQKLDLKSQSPNWKVHENSSPEFLSIRHKTAHVSLGMDKNCLVMLTSWWHDKPDPAFLDKELEQVFLFGQGSDTAVSAFTGRLSGNDYDLGLSLNGTNFFENFKKNPQEETLFNEFRDYLSFQLTAKAKESTGEVSLEGEYDYVKPVLNSDFGLRIAGKLDEFRDGSNSPGCPELSVTSLKSFCRGWTIRRRSICWAESTFPNPVDSKASILTRLTPDPVCGASRPVFFP